jgi:hypothetical protein
MTKRRQVLVIVDLDAEVPTDKLTSLMPHEREHRDVVRLTDFGAPRLERRGPSPQPVDWSRIGTAVETAVAKVRELSGDQLGLDLYVGGFAPLTTFAHLGYALSKFAGTQTLLHCDFGGGEWQAYPLTDPATADAPTVFDAPNDIPDSASVTTAYVAVYIDLSGRAGEREAIQRLHETSQLSLGAIVNLRSSDPVILRPQNAPIVARELIESLGRIPSFFPHRTGLTLFLAVPAPVAFMVGRALNPTIAGNVLLTNFFNHTYEITTALPFEDLSLPQISSTPADVDARAKVQNTLKEALEDLQRGVTPGDLPAEMEESLRTRILIRLSTLTVTDTNSSEFGLIISQKTLSLGTSMLEALRGVDDDRTRQFVQLLVLHELVHSEQGLRSTNFQDVGRAGVVLEQVDFMADVFALRVTTARTIREASAVRPRELVVPWFEVVVFGISLFDRLIDRVRVRDLPERRLRRYLTWHLQLQRAKTVDTREDVETLLKALVTAELAPVRGKLSSRHDKIVLASIPETEFFCAIDGCLVRRGTHGTFDPRQLVEAVQTYNDGLLQTAMLAIVEENARLLVPWLP